MLNLFIIFFLSFLVPFGMYSASFFISFKDMIFCKIDSYECGFDVVKKVHNNFSITFFSVILMFVIFELEIIIFIILIQNDVFVLMTFFLFIVYIVLSFYMEWYFGKLSWMI